ncbi:MULTISPECIES: purine-cytosine permease family protein [Mycolicibacterium]|jgi:NCS1 family nucleobase:cation symporter-1|uniref:Permease for cytosine/purines, uracil, thiamine, allantoin n=2 Tax=Mycolicibacterium TaxID=1866885 RepID=A1TAI0_MYCVP|nr:MULTISPECIES: cytosine permease [Mycolicibacterium]ABM14180.1 permease for cytosine/purines, uracil, thiamine, allantoin [Mycolicibacterium vanbaalenii PYR-1]MCV7126750.1 cytosine permease [Mycolicibacterium vanbaalenii PYR-1]MDN4520263.1 cytosine permease [Mycolicibacterium austroafricanum]MDW5614728.1 cytosine permease [Mycolicibacterium sp. D5.8-2]PQP42197.1 cytosine permease [Mycolicibacterium austroafricanum]
MPQTSPGSTTGALTGEVFSGHQPSGVGDLSVETHGIAPISGDHRYGSPGRLFTVWFAPQVNMSGVFTGTLAIVLGLGFWLGLLAMVIGTVLGSLVVGYLSTWGPRTGTGQLPNARMAFGGTVVVPAALQWLSSIAWDALVGLFGGEALSVLLGIPFWVAVLIVLGVQGVVGFFGYELIHRLQAVLTVVLFVTFLVFTAKLVAGHEIVVPAAVSGPDLVGAFVLEVTIAFSLAISWATYAADFSRYLPADVSPVRVFGFSTAGLALGYVFVQGVGIAAAGVVGEHTVEGVRSVMGGGLLGGLALLVIAVASIGSGVMNDYSGSLALQTLGVRVRRPVSAVIVTVLAFALILWLHAADTATRFTDVLLLVSYWIPAFVAVVVVDWWRRAEGRPTVDPAAEVTGRRDAVVALVVFVVSYLAAIPFMNTSLIQGPVAMAWHGADIAYFVNLAVAAVLYGGYRLMSRD